MGRFFLDSEGFRVVYIEQIWRLVMEGSEMTEVGSQIARGWGSAGCSGTVWGDGPSRSGGLGIADKTLATDVPRRDKNRRSWARVEGRIVGSRPGAMARNKANFVVFGLGMRVPV